MSTDSTRHQPLAKPISANLISHEISLLAPPLAQQGKLQVFLATAHQIPHTLLEIGRLREQTFRAVGEGTGQACDIDSFDQHYLHLILWDSALKSIAGGYRMGRTDEALSHLGFEGLLTHSFFGFDQSFLKHLHPGLELGRAFICQSHQKSIFALALLWKGILKYIELNPQYTKLFGCVSISNDYSSTSKEIMVRFLRKAQSNYSLSLQPINPYRSFDLGSISPNLESVESVSAQISSLEPDGKGLPVLLRQYLKLNATLLEFNIDQDFGNALDALVLVDVADIPINMLKRYLGSEQASDLLKSIQRP